jgi:hypothetical protein
MEKDNQSITLNYIMPALAGGLAGVVMLYGFAPERWRNQKTSLFFLAAGGLMGVWLSKKMDSKKKQSLIVK